MKKYIKLFAVAGVIMFAASCNDDFLERAPLNAISDASFWKTPNDLKLYCNSFYNENQNLAMEYAWGTLYAYSDDADNGSDTQVRTSYNPHLNGETVVPATGGGWDWGPLRNINYFLDNYTKVKADFDAVKQYVGEALWFRCQYMYNKVRRFGDIPWAETTIQVESPELYGPRLPRGEVVTKILADLDKAIEYLPARGNGTWTGRITREVAIALAARIALFEGTWEKYHATDPFAAATDESRKFLDKAAELAGALIAMSESSGYPALDNVGVEYGYRDLFNLEDYSGSKEILLWRKYGSNTAGFYSVQDRYSANGAYRGATKNLIDSYLKADGTPVAANYDDSSLVAITTNRDPRLEQTIGINNGKQVVWMSAPVEYFVAPKLDMSGEENCPTGYQTYKGHNWRYSGPRWPGEGFQAVMYYRYAETLLIYAEAKAELGTLTQSDLDRSINKLRQRVGMPPMSIEVAGDPNFEFYELGPLIQEVRRERKVELGLEGHRTDDIMRWAAADELIVGKTPLGSKLSQWLSFKFADHVPQGDPQRGRQTGWDNRVTTTTYLTDADGYILPWGNRLNGGTQGYKFNVSRDYLFPIPTNELTMNPALTQNPGW